MTNPEACTGCGAEGRYSILLSVTPNEDGSTPTHRFYLPNQNVRSSGNHQEVWFCPECMRFVEDSFRASVLYLQAENDQL